LNNVEESDDQLVRRAAHGDQGAFCALADRYAVYLFRVARSLVGDDTDAEDVVQQTLTGAFRGLAGFRGRASVKTWLTGIAVRQAAKWRQSRLRSKAVSIDAVDGTIEGSGVRPATAAVDSRIDVATILAKLPPEYRQVLVLRELEGMSYEEIANALSIPRGTVESRLHRARLKLKSLLKGYWT